MKLLLVDVCARYMNPTNGLIPALLQMCADDVVIYGPGYSSEHELEEGLETFVDRHGPFDFLVTTRIDMEFAEYDLLFYSRYMYPTYPSGVLKAFSEDVCRVLARSDIARIVFLTAMDPYALPDKYAQIIEDTRGHFVCWAEGFTKPLAELDPEVFFKEEFYLRYKKLGRDFERWYKLTARLRHKFINLGHFVAETEFAWSSISMRDRRALAPGQMYVRREQVRNTLAKNGMLRRSGSVKLAASVMDYLGLRPYSRPLFQLLFNQVFVQNIASSSFAYTDGSGYEYPIRKYFEIPALGTIMLCAPSAGFEDLGFVDGQNAIVADPAAVADVVRSLGSEPDRMQAIASEGRQLVWRRHSLHARAEQLSRSLDAVRAGRFAGSRWDKGDYVVDTAV